MLNDELAEDNQSQSMSTLVWIMLVPRSVYETGILILRHGLKQFTVGVSGQTAFLSAWVKVRNVQTSVIQSIYSRPSLVILIVCIRSSTLFKRLGTLIQHQLIIL